MTFYEFDPDSAEFCLVLILVLCKREKILHVFPLRGKKKHLIVSWEAGRSAGSGERDTTTAKQTAASGWKLARNQ